MTRVVTVSSEENVENNLLLSLPRGSPVESTRSLSEPDRALSQATLRPSKKWTLQHKKLSWTFPPEFRVQIILHLSDKRLHNSCSICHDTGNT